MNHLAHLKQLCSALQKRWEVTYGVNELEDLLLEILTFLKAHPDNRLEFSNYFVDRIKRKVCFPLEAIIFSMRELQWPEIKEAAIQERAKTNDWRIITFMNQIIAVYEEEDWLDGEMYAYYRKEH